MDRLVRADIDDTNLYGRPKCEYGQGALRRLSSMMLRRKRRMTVYFKVMLLFRMDVLYRNSTS